MPTDHPTSEEEEALQELAWALAMAAGAVHIAVTAGPERAPAFAIWHCSKILAPVHLRLRVSGLQ